MSTMLQILRYILNSWKNLKLGQLILRIVNNYLMEFGRFLTGSDECEKCLYVRPILEFALFCHPRGRLVSLTTSEGSVGGNLASR